MCSHVLTVSFQKWIEPAVKIQRQLSEAEEANTKNRKRLRGIALAIQSVISLLYLVRSRNANNAIINNSNGEKTTSNNTATSNNNLINDNNNSVIKNSSTLVQSASTLDVADGTQTNGSASPSSATRIPRPKPNSAAMQLAEIRKAVATPTTMRRQGGTVTPNTSTSLSQVTLTSRATQRPTSQYAPDYSFKKGFFKREEVIKNNGVVRPRRYVRKTSVLAQSEKKETKHTTPVTSTPIKDKTKKFRPSSVIEIRPENEKVERDHRPSSAQGFSSSKDKVDNKHAARKTTLTSSPKKSPLKTNVSSSANKNVNSTPLFNGSSTSDNVVGESCGTASNGVKLRKRTPRSRPSSMVELPHKNQLYKRNSSVNGGVETRDVSRSPKKLPESSVNKSEPVQLNRTPLRSSLRCAKQRPTSLLINSNEKNTSRKALTPTTDEFNRKRLQYKLSDQLNDVKKNEVNAASGRLSPRKNSKFKLSNLSSPRCRSPTRRSEKNSVKETPTRSSSSQRGRSPVRQPLKKEVMNASTSNGTPSPASRKSSSVNRGRSDSEASQSRTPLARKLSSSSVASNKECSSPRKWNSGTAIKYKQPKIIRLSSATKKNIPKTSNITSSQKNSSPKLSNSKTDSSKTTNDSPGKVHITTEVNKRKNIKFPDGKTVDKQTKTTTTVSMDVVTDKKDRNELDERESLLAKVKTLAQEIGTLTKMDVNPSSTDSSSDSIVTHTLSTNRPGASRSSSDVVAATIKEETDRFSETEYLSFVEHQK